MSKLRFAVCFSSGEEPENPADELNAHSPHTRGWQSPQFCNYPQELGLATEAPALITQVQILSHQSKIATQIELFVGHGDSYESAQFRRLGYLSLNSNERSKYQARELKSVYVQAAGQYLRLKVHKCYINEANLFNQVGIVAVNLLGDKLGKLAPGTLDALPAPYGAGPRNVPEHIWGSRGRGLGAAKSSATELNDLSFDMNFDSETARRIREIAAAKDRAVRSEDYDTAKLLKEAETQLKSLGQQLAQLDVAKREAVEDEDYDRAKMLKAEADALRLQIAAHPRPELQDKLEEAEAQNGDGGGGDALRGSSFNGALGQDDGASMASRGRTKASHSPHLHVDDRPLGAQTNDRARKFPQGDSPDDRSADGSARGRAGFAVADDSQASPPTAKPRILHSSEGGQPRPSPHTRRRWEGDQGEESLSGDEGFPPGEHPLEGVSHVEGLPAPEALSSKVDLSEVQGLNGLFGQYLTRCLYSKTWSLREAAVLKIKLMMPALAEDPGVNAALTEICQVLRVGFEDKIAQVFVTTLELLDASLASIETCKEARHNHVVAALEPTVATLLNKLGDGQARLRDGAMHGLVALARCRTAGPSFVSHVALKPLVRKQLSAWRPITARLNLLKQLVSEFGLEGGSDLAVPGIMGFVQSCNGFAHSNGDVRDAARELTVTLQAIIGDEIEPYLAGLRPKQLDEYHEAFRNYGGKTSGRTVGSRSAANPMSSRRGSAERSPRGPATATPRAPPRTDESRTPASGRRRPPSDSPVKTGRGRPRPSPPRSRAEEALEADDRDEYDEEAEEDEETKSMCQFCGKYDLSFTEEKLDMHYWQKCPMLMSCAECGQVIEISSIPEHLLDECQNCENFSQCDISYLAIRTEELDQWQRSEACKPPGPAGPHSTCPLCFASVGRQEDEEAWRAHLMEACRKNPRRPRPPR